MPGHLCHPYRVGGGGFGIGVIIGSTPRVCIPICKKGNFIFLETFQSNFLEEIYLLTINLKR